MPETVGGPEAGSLSHLQRPLGGDPLPACRSKLSCGARRWNRTFDEQRCLTRDFYKLSTLFIVDIFELGVIGNYLKVRFALCFCPLGVFALTLLPLVRVLQCHGRGLKNPIGAGLLENTSTCRFKLENEPSTASRLRVHTVDGKAGVVTLK